MVERLDGDRTILFPTVPEILPESDVADMLGPNHHTLAKWATNDTEKLVSPQVHPQDRRRRTYTQRDMRRVARIIQLKGRLGSDFDLCTRSLGAPQYPPEDEEQIAQMITQGYAHLQKTRALGQV